MYLFCDKDDTAQLLVPCELSGIRDEIFLRSFISLTSLLKLEPTFWKLYSIEADEDVFMKRVRFYCAQ